MAIGDYIDQQSYNPKPSFSDVLERVKRARHALLDFGMFVCGIGLRDQTDLSVLRYDFVNHTQGFSATPDAGAGCRSCAASSDGRLRISCVCRGVR